AGVSAARAYLDADGPRPVLILTTDPHPPNQRPPQSKQGLRGTAEPEPTVLDELPDAVELRRGVTVTRADLGARTLWAAEEPIRF
ncbi:NAD(P)/FAD-dependent oxidoreductase, partial [Pseudomonas sp. BGM005]|nr:NAD(P)/FAD-dependent oxidoreductase [Pseudomonas sp. BG5]